MTREEGGQWPLTGGTSYAYPALNRHEHVTVCILAQGGVTLEDFRQAVDVLVHACCVGNEWSYLRAVVLNIATDRICNTWADEEASAS